MSKKDSAGKPAPMPSGMERIDLQAESALVRRSKRQAKRLGLSHSAYIRLALTERVEADEAKDPDLQEGG